jgi:hypothetical protein
VNDSRELSRLSLRGPDSGFKLEVEAKEQARSCIEEQEIEPQNWMRSQPAGPAAALRTNCSSAQVRSRAWWGESIPPRTSVWGTAGHRFSESYPAGGNACAPPFATHPFATDPFALPPEESTRAGLDSPIAGAADRPQARSVFRRWRVEPQAAARLTLGFLRAYHTRNFLSDCFVASPPPQGRGHTF